ncbi:MAG: hypothetical protein V3S43_06415 [Acidimicrobiia bacterium]
MVKVLDSADRTPIVVGNRAYASLNEAPESAVGKYVIAEIRGAMKAAKDMN